MFPTTATLLLLVATVYLVFYTFHQESLMGFVPPAMVGLLSLIFLPFFTKMFCSVGDCFKFLWPSQNIQTLIHSRYGILLLKIFLLTVRKNCSSDREKLLKFEAEGKIFEITRTIYSNSERSEQFLVTECFFNLFLEVSQI